jgi:hypothetical protein
VCDAHVIWEKLEVAPDFSGRVPNVDACDSPRLKNASALLPHLAQLLVHTIECLLPVAAIESVPQSQDRVGETGHPTSRSLDKAER